VIPPPAPARPPRGLLLDAMGTLIGLREPVGQTYARLAGEHGITVEAAAVQQAFGQAWRQAPPLAFPGLTGEALAEAERRWWWQRIDASLVGAGGRPATAELVDALLAHYANATAWRVYADVPPLLQRWRQRGLALAVVSNFDSRLEGLLEALDLRHWLQAVVISSSAGAAKPQPEPFQQALALLQLAPGEAWHVGDSPEDAAGAAAAGVRFIQVQRR